jgi:hypothetical protein
MQTMDSSIIPSPKKNLTDMQEKFLEVLFGEAKGDPRVAAEIAGYAKHSYPKVVRNLKKEITELAENHLSTHSAKAATQTHRFARRRWYNSTCKHPSSRCHTITR